MVENYMSSQRLVQSIRNGFEENQDYTAIAQKRPTAQGNQTSFTDYAMKIDMAKEIAMIQRKC